MDRKVGSGGMEWFNICHYAKGNIITLWKSPRKYNSEASLEMYRKVKKEYSKIRKQQTFIIDIVYICRRRL